MFITSLSRYTDISVITWGIAQTEVFGYLAFLKKCSLPVRISAPSSLRSLPHLGWRRLSFHGFPSSIPFFLWPATHWVANRHYELIDWLIDMDFCSMICQCDERTSEDIDKFFEEGKKIFKRKEFRSAPRRTWSPPDRELDPILARKQWLMFHDLRRWTHLLPEISFYRSEWTVLYFSHTALSLSQRQRQTLINA